MKWNFRQWTRRFSSLFLMALILNQGFCLFHEKRAEAAEGAIGLYLLGFQGGPLAGFMPPPGFYFRNDVYYYAGNAGAAVLQGKVDLGLDEIVFGDLFSFSYVSKFKILGANYSASLTMPVLLGNLSATITGAGPGPGLAASQSNGGQSDLVLVPISLGWHHKNFNFIAQNLVFFPTGQYSLNRVVNVGRNHYAFDPEFGFTWLQAPQGNEVSLNIGTTINLTNNATDYRTGEEFHTEFSYTHHFFTNPFAGGGLALGAGGYFYQQLTGDSGTGAVLGPFKGRVVGLGPQLTYSTKLAGHDFSFNARYYKEFLAKNRFEGNTFFFTIAYKLF